MNQHASAPQPPARARRDLHLPGLDGANPLGFLAALGLFRILTEATHHRSVTLSWSATGGTWVAVLHPGAGAALDEEALLDSLAKSLLNSIDDHPARLLSELDLRTDDVNGRRAILREIVEGDDRARMAWAAALASDFAASDSINQLQTTRRDYFYGNLASVIARTRADHLRRAILRPWDYADALDNQSLHLDPSEDRRHAHQWNQPAGDPDRKVRGGMLGANRLALEAIPLFPSFPESNTLHTLGFTGHRSTNTRWTWPLWKTRLSLPVVTSLLANSTLQNEVLRDEDLASLDAQGVVAVYRTRRILVGKTPNFTPALGLGGGRGGSPARGTPRAHAKLQTP